MISPSKELGAGNGLALDMGSTAEWDVVAAMVRFTGPIIGAVSGPAITGGLEIALACDVLLAWAAQVDAAAIELRRIQIAQRGRDQKAVGRD